MASHQCRASLRCVKLLAPTRAYALRALRRVGKRRASIINSDKSGMSKLFERKVARVTGASTGSGRTTAIAFGREGALDTAVNNAGQDPDTYMPVHKYDDALWDRILTTQLTGGDRAAGPPVASHTTLPSPWIH
jgi:hypothetical protein